MLNYLLAIFSALVLLLGLVLLVSPIPMGVFLIAIGLSGLISTHLRTQLLIQHWRSNHQSFNQKLHWLEAKIEGRIHFISRALHLTRPTHQDISDKKGQ